jgi:anti-sigma factor RsiW
LSDRTDIDALMMGSLYGELDAHEVARLEAHLEAHPQDRAELASLRRTREAVRELPLLEPSAALTAKLMHEAARHVPRKAVAVPLAEEGGGLAAWFSRIFRPVLLHPAMAGAATLVLVGGVAGTLYLRGQRVAQPMVRSAQPQPAALEQPKAESELVAHWSDHEEAPPPPTATADFSTAASNGDSAGAIGKAAKEGYRVDLEGQGAYRLADQRKATESAATSGRADKLRHVGGKEPAPLVASAISGTDPLLSEDDADGRDRFAAPAGGAAKKQAAGRAGDAVVVDVPAPAPMEPEAANRMAVGSTGTSDAKAKGPVAQPTKAATKPSSYQLADRGGAAAGMAAPAAPAAESIAPQQASRDEAKAEAAKSTAELAWARMQHGKLTAAIKAKKCREAAQLANDLLDRNPDYYLSTVAGSKDVKSCQYYVDSEAKRRAAATHKSRARQSPDMKEAMPANAE